VLEIDGVIRKWVGDAVHGKHASVLSSALQLLVIVAAAIHNAFEGAVIVVGGEVGANRAEDVLVREFPPSFQRSLKELSEGLLVFDLASSRDVKGLLPVPSAPPSFFDEIQSLHEEEELELKIGCDQKLDYNLQVLAQPSREAVIRLHDSHTRRQLALASLDLFVGVSNIDIVQSASLSLLVKEVQLPVNLLLVIIFDGRERSVR